MYSVCTDPEFMAVNVMDPDSKQHVASKLNLLPEDIRGNIQQSLQLECAESTRQDLKSFLQEFCRRNQTEIDMLPKAFVKWINQ
jgi:hypothetical protein